MAESGEQDKVYVIDSTLMLYRYFRGLPAMSANGRRTEAVYGYGKMLLSLMAKRPGGVIAVFDHGQHNFRNYVLPAYKENYIAMPAELKAQQELAQQMCAVLGVDVYNVNEVEADDVIATLAKKVVKLGKEVVVVSTDHDFFQLIDDHTQVLVPAAENQGLGEVPILYDESAAYTWLRMKYDVTFDPKLIADLKAIAGSTAKGIPGVRGIGEKGAAKLVAQYGSVDKIVKALAKMPSGKGSPREKIEASLGNLMMSRELTKVSTDVRLKQFKPESVTGLKSYDTQVANTFFEVLGMKDLARKSRRLADTLNVGVEVVGGHDDASGQEIVLETAKGKPEPLFC